MRFPVLIASALLIAGLTAACQPVQPETTTPDGAAAESAMPAMAMMPTVFVLPDGSVCTFAGTGATLAFDGERLNYTCEAAGPQTVVLGEVLASDSGYVATVGSVSHGDDGFALDSSESAAVSVTGWALEDSTECLSTGEGGGLAFDGKRLNYDCGAVDGKMAGLLDEPTQDDSGAWMGDYAVISHGDNGFVLDSSEMVTVTPVRIGLDDGSECLWAGRGATLAFDGERVNYNCTNPSAPMLGLLGDSMQDDTQGAGVWTVNLATYSHGDDGFTLDSSTPVTFFAAEIDLDDDSVCLHAGFGATLGFDGERLNYTCGDTDAGSTGIIGDLQYDAAAMPGVYLAQKVLFHSAGDAGFALDSSELRDVTRIVGEDLPQQ